MADTFRELLSRPATGLKVVAYQRDCGWHVLISETKPGPHNELGYRRIVAKTCVPHYSIKHPTVKNQLDAMIIGVDQITHSDTGGCRNL